MSASGGDPANGARATRARSGLAARCVGGAITAFFAAVDDARRDLEQLTLRVVEGNKAAIALYERFGFRVYGVEPRARKTATGYADVVEMVLFLAAA